MSATQSTTPRNTPQCAVRPLLRRVLHAAEEPELIRQCRAVTADSPGVTRAVAAAWRRKRTRSPAESPPRCQPQPGSPPHGARAAEPGLPGSPPQNQARGSQPRQSPAAPRVGGAAAGAAESGSGGGSGSGSGPTNKGVAASPGETPASAPTPRHATPRVNTPGVPWTSQSRSGRIWKIRDSTTLATRPV